MTWDALAQKFVVPRVRVTYVSSHGEIHVVRLKLFRRSRPSDPARILLAGMFGNGLLLLYGASGKQFPYTPRERPDVFDVQFLTTFGCTFASEPSGLVVGQAFLFGPRERLFFDQHPLSLVALSRTTKPNHNRPERRVAAGSTGQRSISAPEENKLVEVGTRQAESPFGFQTKKATFPELLATFRADGVTDDPEDNDLVPLLHAFGAVHGFGIHIHR